MVESDSPALDPRATGKRRRAKAEDATAPLPGAMRGEAIEGTMLVPAAIAREQTVRMAERYIDLLVKHEGNYIEALKEIGLMPAEEREGMGVSESEILAVHDRLLDCAVDELPLRTMMRRAGFSRTARVRILASWGFSGHPGASLKAVEMAENMDDAERGGSEDTWEARVRRAMTLKGVK